MKKIKHLFCYLIFLIFLILLFTVNVIASPGPPDNIKLNLYTLDNPVEIEDISPLLSWEFNDVNYKNTYMGYKIQISRTSDFSDSVFYIAELTSSYHYSLSITTTGTYYLRMQINADNEWSPWSATKTFVQDLEPSCSLNVEPVYYTNQAEINYTVNFKTGPVNIGKLILYWGYESTNDFTDSSGLIDYISKYTITANADTVYIVKLTVIDNYGNEKSTTGTDTFRINSADTTPPEILKVEYSSVLNNNDTLLNVKTEITDNNLDYVDYKISLDSSGIFKEIKLYYSGSNIFEYKFDNIDLYGRDTVYLIVTAFDVKNNFIRRNYIIDVIETHKDILPPTITFDGIKNNSIIYEDTAQLRITVSDSSGVKESIVKINDASYYFDFDTTVYFTAIDSGIYYIYITAKDIYENDVTKFLSFRKGDSSVINNEFVITSSVLDDFIDRNGYVKNVIDSIYFTASNEIYKDSITVKVKMNSSELDGVLTQINDTTLMWQQSNGNNLNTGDYAITIYGKDKFNNIIIENSVSWNFYLLVSNTNTQTYEDSNIIIVLDENSCTENIFVETKRLKRDNISSIVQSYEGVYSFQLPEIADNITEINLLNSQGNKVTLLKPVKISLKYNDVENDGIIDYTNVKEDDLFLIKIHNNVLQYISDVTIDKDRNTVTTATDDFSIWAIQISNIPDSLKESLIIYPSGKYADMNKIDYITFRLFSIGGNYEFKIFTKGGRKIWEKTINIQYGDTFNNIKYNLRDEENKLISSGTYLLYVKSPNGENAIKAFSVVK